MNEGLGYLQLHHPIIDDEQVYGLVNAQEAALISSSEATLFSQDGPNHNPQSRFLKAQPADLTDGVLPESQQVVRTSESLDVSHASPLAPLRSRDRNALNDLFEQDNLQDIALDVHRYLARVYPEPCWEDDPYDFLHGFI